MYIPNDYTQNYPSGKGFLMDQRDKTMADKLICNLPNDNTHNYPLCRLQLLDEIVRYLN